ncbi:glycosyltransferase family 4 protein [Flavihumibacter sp. R14]|nr:glycosyltransferase family 4 protein [Flavihumibacter soli]
MKKICIITPGTIASNPRLVKEAEALSNSGYNVHLIYTRHVYYLVETDQKILDDHPEWTYDYLDWSSPDAASKVKKMGSGIKRKIANLILESKLYPGQLVPVLFNRFYCWQLYKAMSCKADLYIAHYPESIAIAARAAKVNNAFFAFDAEDFHRGEGASGGLTEAISTLEDRFLPDAAYITAASPLIAKAYQKLYPGVKITSLENMFQLNKQPTFVELDNNSLKFFWFSQTVGPKRGLEEFIKILQVLGKKNVQLTLLGNCSTSYKTQLQNLWFTLGLKPESLVFKMTVPEAEIFTLAASHHFGLGLEISHSINRDICLTNKIYTYILSGNLLILSNTSAQKNFYEKYPGVGLCIELNDPEQAAARILHLIESSGDINAQRREIYKLGQSTLNFDQEKKVLLKQVENLWA